MHLQVVRKDKTTYKYMFMHTTVYLYESCVSSREVWGVCGKHKTARGSPGTRGETLLLSFSRLCTLVPGYAVRVLVRISFRRGRVCFGGGPPSASLALRSGGLILVYALECISNFYHVCTHVLHHPSGPLGAAVKCKSDFISPLPPMAIFSTLSFAAVGPNNAC